MQSIGNNKKGSRVFKNTLPLSIIGAVLGAMVAYLYQNDILINLEIGDLLQSMPFNLIVNGAIIGFFTGFIISVIKGLFSLQYSVKEDEAYLSSVKNSEEVINDEMNAAKLLLRKEKLDISKKKVDIADVSVHKETLTEEKNIKVPITREELVIEKKNLNSAAEDKSCEDTEVIRIPISEERIDINKNKVNLEDVSIYKSEIHDTEKVTENLKREKLQVKTTGDVKVKNRKTQKR